MNYKKDIIVKHKGEYICVKNSYTGLFDLYERILLDNDKPYINEMIKESENMSYRVEIKNK